jgi:hypothetical protein
VQVIFGPSFEEAFVLLTASKGLGAEGPGPPVLAIWLPEETGVR